MSSINGSVPFVRAKLDFIPNNPLLREEIVSFKMRAQQAAYNVLGAMPEMSGHQPVTVINNYPSPWYYGGRHYGSSSSNGTDSSEDSDGKCGAVAIMCIGAIAAGVFLFTLGAAVGDRQQAAYELEETKAFQDSLFVYREEGVSPEDSRLIAKAKTLADLKGRIEARTKSAAMTSILLRMSALATATLGFVGGATQFCLPVASQVGTFSKSAFMEKCGVAATAITSVVNVSTLLTAAAVSALVIGGISLFRWGWNATERQNKHDAQHIQVKAAEIEALVRA